MSCLSSQVWFLRVKKLSDRIRVAEPEKELVEHLKRIGGTDIVQEHLQQIDDEEGHPANNEALTHIWHVFYELSSYPTHNNNADRFERFSFAHINDFLL